MICFHGRRADHESALFNAQIEKVCARCRRAPSTDSVRVVIVEVVQKVPFCTNNGVWSTIGRMTQSDALKILKTGANVFLTGSPGSGKTHTINAYIRWLHECGIEPAVTAATGIAATHVGGMTLHSWSGIGIKEYLTAADVDAIASKEHVARRIQKAKVLIIEEISMLSAATLGMADSVCREVRHTDQPFGGLQVVFVGDFFQLPPISRGNTSVMFCYLSPVWLELNPLICYLTEPYRQDDEYFLSVLSAIRANDVQEEHYEYLKERHIDVKDVPENVPKLYSHNADVDRINGQELAKLSVASKYFAMRTAGNSAGVEGLKRGCLSPETLELKVGAVVMFTKNHPQGSFVNGTLGTVTSFAQGDGTPVIETNDGRTLYTEYMDWNLETDGKVRASITQIPLRLAWAMTVHKSQGMSMDAAIIDLSRAFEYGQGYVALSRVRRLSGLYLLGLNSRALMVHPEILDKDHDFREFSAGVDETFSEMSKEEVEDMQKKFVKACGGAWAEEGSKQYTESSDTEEDAEENSKQKTVNRKKGKEKKEKKETGALASRLAQTLQSVRDAASLRDAAEERGLTAGTIVNHLEELQKAGKLERKDFEHLLSDEDATRAIRRVFAELGGEKLSPIFNALGGKYGFEHLKLVRILMNTEE